MILNCFFRVGRYFHTTLSLKLSGISCSVHFMWGLLLQWHLLWCLCLITRTTQWTTMSHHRSGYRESVIRKQLFSIILFLPDSCYKSGLRCVEVQMFSGFHSIASVQRKTQMRYNKLGKAVCGQLRLRYIPSPSVTEGDPIDFKL